MRNVVKVVLYRDPGRNSFGVQLKSPDEKERTNAIGCLVRGVTSSCSAPKGAILPEDRLLSIHGKPVLDWPYHEIVSYIEELTSNTVVMTFRRELPKPAKATKASVTSDYAAASSSAGGGAIGAAGAAVATGTSDVPDGNPPPGQAGITAAAAAAAASSPADGASRTPRKSRTPSQGTVPYQEQFQAPNSSPHRGSYEEKWNNHVEALRKFKEKHGHCNVPRKNPSNQSLSEFVQYVRAAWQDLSEERRKSLTQRA